MPHHWFVVPKKKNVCVRLELTTLDVIRHMQYLSKKKREVVFVRLELMTFTLQHNTLPHGNCPRTTGGPGTNL